MQFITSCYGANYAPFLAVCLRSLRQSHPQSKILVSYDDIPAKIVAALKINNPNAVFTKIAAPDSSSTIFQIVSKLNLWLDALRGAEEGVVAFVDADMIIRHDLSSALLPDVDILVTVKQDKVPINTGIMVMRKSPVVLAFVEEWQHRSIAICEDADRMKQSAKNFGAPDQEIVLELIGNYTPAPGLYSATIGNHSVTIQAEPCSIYNETNSVPLSAPAKVLHYKGAWRRIILKGRGYNKSRTEAKSREMLDLWNRMLREEEAELGLHLIPMKNRYTLKFKDLSKGLASRLSALLEKGGGSHAKAGQ